MNQLILIDEHTAAAAATKIREHVVHARGQGWQTGGAFALNDGWRNEYEITRNGQRDLLTFDLRPTLNHVSELELTLATLTLPLSVPANETRTSRERIEPIDIKQRINMLRGMYSTSGAEIFLLDSTHIQQVATSHGLTVPDDAVGILTNDNTLAFNADQALVFRPGAPNFIYTPSGTVLCGPTFIHALEYGYYRLVCNFAGKIDNLTEEDILQHARDLKQWFIAPRVQRPNNQTPPKFCQDVKMTLDFMRDFGRGTPLISLLDKIRKKNSFFGRFFGA
jgi:hypothetical protein